MITDNFNIDKFTLMSGSPIPVEKLGIIIRQPKLFEIAAIGEESFYRYLSFLKITKKHVLDSLSDRDAKIFINSKNEFEVLNIIISSDPYLENGIKTILNLIIEDFEFIKFNESFMLLKLHSGHQAIINEESFLVIKDIIYQIFNLNSKEKEDYNPINDAAAAIAEKLKKAKEKLNQEKGKKGESILSNFISILAVGLNSLNMDDILNLTIYQVFNIMERFGMYSQYQTQIQALMQGAEDIELVDWLKSI
jgi:hypothetical protein